MASSGAATGAGHEPARRSRAGTDARRAAIVDAAVRLFAERGARGTSIAAVAAAVDLTDAGVLYHFPTKTDLFMAVLEHLQRQQRERFDDATRAGGLDALRALAGWGEVMEANPELVALQAILSAEALAGEPHIRRYFVDLHRGRHDRIATLLRDAVAAGEADPQLDVDAEATALLSHLNGLRLQWLLEDRTLPLADLVRRYVDQLIDRIAVGG
ncbi:MAG TPA: TetR family transcriptional regulator [Acidimicrobiales bacterium]|nr:TetR family transcriptional regulator [Acidimicrobiales bacterium]